MEINNQKEFSPEVKKILNSMNLEVEPETKSIGFNLDGLEETISELKGSGEAFHIEASGISINLISKTRSMIDLQKIAHESFNFVLSKADSKYPTGVN